MQVPLAALTEPLRATLVGSDATIERVITDSRLARPGDLFVPLVAERDGHDFIGAALAAGATAALSERSADNLGLDLAARLLLVAHTGAALNDLAGFARARMSGSVIGVTGSVGKTTVKDLMAGVLATKLVTSASERSFNNEIGVPLTLCNAPDDVEALVVEMGARGPGHIAALCELAHPRVGVVTVVAGAHLELFGDLAGVAVAKGELIEALPADGTAVLNADDPFVAAMAARSAAPVLTFGRGRRRAGRRHRPGRRPAGLLPLDQPVGVGLGAPGDRRRASRHQRWRRLRSPSTPASRSSRLPRRWAQRRSARGAWRWSPPPVGPR